MKTFAFAVAATGLAFAASPALANANSVPTETISTAGIDLATPEGRRIIDERIESAVRRVCRVDHLRVGTQIRSMAARDCLSRERASARSQVAAIAESQQRGG